MNESLAILIAEESEEYQGRIVRSLASLDCPKTIDCADSVASALEMLEARAYDLAISGLHFSNDREGRSGFTVLREVDRAHPQTRAILVTAWDNEENRLIGERYGARAIVSKANIENRLGPIVEGVVRPTGEERPNYGTLGRAVLDRVAEMPVDAQVAFVVDLLEKFQQPLSSESSPKARGGELSLALVARQPEDAQALIALSERFAEACYWINANLPPTIDGHIRARKQILDPVKDRFGRYLGSTHLQECIGAAIAARQMLGNPTPEAVADLAFPRQVIYPKTAMEANTVQKAIGLRVGTDPDRKLWLDLATETSMVALERFSSVHLGELIHRDRLQFDLRLKFL